MGVHKRFGFGTSDTSITYDGRSGMSIVAFRTASPIGGLLVFTRIVD